MFVERCVNNGTEYLRLVQSYRTTDKNGRKVARKRTILNIGPLARFDDGKPDYVQRLKQSFKDGKPLIDSLLPYVEATVEPKKYTITFTEGEDGCIAHPKLFSQALLDRVFQGLGLVY